MNSQPRRPNHPISHRLSALALAAMLGSPCVLAATPSFNTIETKINSFRSSTVLQDSYSGSISGSFGFADRFFAASSIAFGSNVVGRDDMGVGLGIFQPSGENTALFASIGGQRYSDYDRQTNINRDYNTAAISLGIKSLVLSNAELEFAATQLTSGPISTRVALKGSYYFNDHVGAVLELGSSNGNGDSTGGIGVRINF